MAARRKMSPVERAARDAIAPYVKAKHMTHYEANKTIRGALADTEDVVRGNLAVKWGSLGYYGKKVADAEREYNAIPHSNLVGRHMKRVRLLATEIFLAVYKAARVDYLTAEEIEQDDREAPIFAMALEVLTEEAAAARARVSTPGRYLVPAA